MTSNAQAAGIFRDIADLLDVLGERFKPEAYRRAARSIETLTEDLGEVASRNELRTIPGVGEAIEEKLREYLKTGKFPYYERLKREVPPGVVELMRLPGLGPKTARRFWVELGLEGPSEVRDAIAAGKLDGVKGFGPRKIEQIRATLEQAVTNPAGGRVAIEIIYPVAERLVTALRERSTTDRVEAAGSFRRRRETVGDLDVLVTSDAPEKVFDLFSALPEVREVKMRGGTKETVVLQSGLQVDLRVVEPVAFGAAWLYFTGSKDHNIHLRSIARDRGLKINEYGVFRGAERVGGRTEEEVYATLGLPFIPPEIREDRGEIEAAAQGHVPRLVEESDLLGDLHVHLPRSPSTADIDRLFMDARQRRFTYLGLVVGGVASDGAPFSLPTAALERIEATRPPGLKVLRVIETAGAPSSSAAPPKSDYRVVRATSAAPSPPSGGRAAAPVRLVAHFGSGEGRTEDPRQSWLLWARSAGAAVEVGPGPDRLDSNWARRARESAIPLALPTGIGSPPDDPTRRIALGFARRAAAEPRDVANANPLGEAARRVPRSDR
jgi:DNA polymerase/3'-5' exonuclease PolX